MTKCCTKCKVDKDLSEFRKTPHTKKYKYGVDSVCLECSKILGRAYYHRPEVRAKQLARGKTRVRVWEHERNTQLKNMYGITVIEYDAMVAKQNGLCAICGQPETRTSLKGNVTRLSIDHCHTTGKVRGLLCSRCNIAIGLFEDDLDFVENALAYLKGAKLSG